MPDKPKMGKHLLCLGFDYEALGALGYYYHIQFFFKLSAKIYMMPIIH
jgi:hypothetical protein